MFTKRIISINYEFKKGDNSMANWLYCQVCQQWSKSTTSDGEYCSFCNNLFNGQGINLASDKEVIEKLKELHNNATILEKTKITKKQLEVPEVSGKTEMIEISAGPGIFESAIKPEKTKLPEMPEAAEVSETPEPIETFETPMVLESSETPAKNEVSITTDTSEVSAEPVIIETLESYDTFESYEISTKSYVPTENSEPPKEKKVPAHRLYMENKRRSKKRR
jgi:hypothetical protein